MSSFLEEMYMLRVTMVTELPLLIWKFFPLVCNLLNFIQVTFWFPVLFLMFRCRLSSELLPVGDIQMWSTSNSSQELPSANNPSPDQDNSWSQSKLSKAQNHLVFGWIRLYTAESAMNPHPSLVQDIYRISTSRFINFVLCTSVYEPGYYIPASLYHELRFCKVSYKLSKGYG